MTYEAWENGERIAVCSTPRAQTWTPEYGNARWWTVKLTDDAGTVVAEAQTAHEAMAKAHPRVHQAAWCLKPTIRERLMNTLDPLRRHRTPASAG